MNRPSISRPALKLDQIAPHGRDELNIAEFPIARLSSDENTELKSLSFTDTVTDRGNGKPVTRSVTVEGSATLGLPRPFDMDVLLCLIQLTKATNNFTDRMVYFHRGELLDLMRMTDAGDNYERLTESIKLWLGVTLYYDQSWWDNEEKRWTSVEGIHVLESVNILTRHAMRKRSLPNQLELFRCSITWNPLFFKSFAAGNIKYLDMNTYFALKRPISRQMFRFLDKRFYRDRSLTFDLRTFACEHVGLSRNYDTGKLKSKLQPALAELEKAGILETSSPAVRYRKDGKVWKITLTRPSKPSDEETAGLLKDPPAPVLSPDGLHTAPDQPAITPVEEALIRHGITPAKAVQLAKKHESGIIATYIEYLDFELKHKPDKIGNPAAWLYTAFKDGRNPPKGFKSREEQQRQAEEKKAATEREAKARREKRRQEAAEKSENQAINAYWEALSPAEQVALEAKAMDDAPADERSGSHARFFKTAYRMNYIKKLLREAGRLPPSGG